MEEQNRLMAVRLTKLVDGEKIPRGKFHAVKVYITPDDYNDIIARHLSKEQREEYKNCSWVPVELKLNTTNMNIEGVFVPSV